MINKRSLWILFVLSTVFFFSGAFLPVAQAGHYQQPFLLTPKDSVSKKRIYTTERTQTPPVIDGKLSDVCWNSGEWQSDYLQFSPVYKGKATLKTDLKILYDDRFVYVAIRAHDKVKDISRRLSRRDNFSGDIVGFQFDSYFDHRTAFEFDLTAAGQKIDVWVSNDGWDVNWNAVWYGKVAYEDTAWTAEFKIPFSQLRYSAAPEQKWGLDSWRYVDRIQEENQWNPVANDGTGLVYTFGELHGLKNVKKARRFELAPYVSSKITTNKPDQENPFAKRANLDGMAGLDAKIGISNNFTLDATINPDFGQVEADPSVMNLTAFETYFEEKRPFFVEGKNIFDYTFDKDQLFYTRRIGHFPSYTPGFDTLRMPEYTTIGGAFKLSGKTSKGLSIGIIESVAMKETADIHDHLNDFKQTVEPLTNYFIGRFQKDYDKGNTIIGGILTHTHREIRNDYLKFLSRNALSYGLDFTKYWKDRTYFIELKTIGSRVNGSPEAVQRLQTSSARYLQRPGITGMVYDSSLSNLNGYGSSLKFGKWSKGHWRYNEEFITRSPGLELNDLGYMPISDIIKNNTNIIYQEKQNTKSIKTYAFTFQQQNAWNFHRQSLYSLLSLTSEIELLNGWGSLFTGHYKFRNNDDWLLRGGPSMKMPDLLELSFLLHTNTAKDFYVNLSGNISKGMARNLTYFGLTPEFIYRPWSNISLSLIPTYLKNSDDLQYITQVSESSGNKSYILGKVNNQNLGLTFRFDFALTPEFMIQYYGSPFASLGKYSDFKVVTNPNDRSYSNRFTKVEYTIVNGIYQFDKNKDGVIDFSIPNPNFNFLQFKSNLVLRWEYKTGSTLYLVWAQDRTTFMQPGNLNFSESYHQMNGIFPKNIFILKFNYWFSAL